MNGGMVQGERGSEGASLVSLLVQRAVSEDPRWTRAVGDHLIRPQEKAEVSHGRAQLRLGQPPRVS